jgi:hypothetical protein
MFLASKAIFIGDDISPKVAAQGMRPTDKGLNWIDNPVGRQYPCQGGGAATQMPAEHYHSGSNPDLGLNSQMQHASNIF